MDTQWVFSSLLPKHSTGVNGVVSAPQHLLPIWPLTPRVMCRVFVHQSQELSNTIKMANKRALVTATAVVISSFLQEMEEFDDDEENINEVEQLIILRKLAREEKIKIRGYSEVIVDLYSNADFQSHFRLTRSSFHRLLKYLNEKNTNFDCPGNPEIPLEKQLKICLWILGNQEVYRSVADRFGVSKSTCWQSVIRICNLLVDNRADFIRWPRGEAALEEAKKFQDIAGFPGVVGAIDGSYIPISTPSEHQESYVCRKKFHAINMQGVCTPDLKFTSVDIGSPGSMHDARVLRRSSLLRQIREHKSAMFPQNSHMIGDAAYPISDVLMVPFKNMGNLTEAQIKYNKKLSSTRVVIERAFGLLKGRFRRLKYMYMHRTDMIPLLILAACILHNVCIEFGDDFQEIDPENTDDAEPSSENPFDNVQEGRNKRNFLVNYLQNNV